MPDQEEDQLLASIITLAQQEGNYQAGVKEIANKALIAKIEKELSPLSEYKNYNNLLSNAVAFVLKPSAITSAAFFSSWKIAWEDLQHTVKQTAQEDAEEEAESELERGFAELKQEFVKLEVRNKKLVHDMEFQSKFTKSLQAEIEEKNSEIIMLKSEESRLLPLVSQINEIRRQREEAIKSASDAKKNADNLELELTKARATNERLADKNKELNVKIEELDAVKSEEVRKKSISRGSLPKSSSSTNTTTAVVGSLHEAKQRAADPRDAQLADLQKQLSQAKSQLAVAVEQPESQLRQEQHENKKLTSRVEQLEQQFKSQEHEQKEQKAIEAKQSEVYKLLHNVLNDNVAFWAQQQSQIPMRGVEVKLGRGTIRVPTGVGNMINRICDVEINSNNSGAKLHIIEKIVKEANDRAAITGMFGRKTRAGRTDVTAEFYSVFNGINPEDLNRETTLKDIKLKLETLQRNKILSANQKKGAVKK